MTKYLTIEQAVALAPGFTKNSLAQMRFQGTGPKYLKPSPKKVLYREQDIIDWLEGSERTGTAVAA